MSFELHDAIPPLPVVDLRQLLQTLQPQLNDGVYVFASLPHGASLGELKPIAIFREQDGLSVIVAECDAHALNLRVLLRAAWITLSVHSDLQAIGLTAAVSAALTSAGISCNMVAAACHDHMFVPVEQAESALTVLRDLQQYTLTHD